MEQSSFVGLPEQSAPYSSSKKGLLQAVRLPRKPSLPSLFLPPSSGLHSFAPSETNAASSSSTVVIASDSSVPVPSLLLDEDPFAALASPSSVSVSSHAQTLLDMGCPPLSESVKPSVAQVSPRVPVPHPSIVRPKSSGQARPAYTRPAFGSRPSLPSLRTLVQMNVVVPKKVRKGTVGARLPHEPWNLDLSGHPAVLAHARSVSVSPPPTMDSAATASLSALQGSPCSSDDTSGGPVLRGESDLLTPAGQFASREKHDERACSRSFSMHDADMDSLPSLSYTTSELSSSALSYAASPDSGSSPCIHPENSHTLSFSVGPEQGMESAVDEEDPLSYHSDFDYYTQSLSDLSDWESDQPSAHQQRAYSPDPVPTPYNSIYQEIPPSTSLDIMPSIVSHRSQIHAPSKNTISPQKKHGQRVEKHVPLDIQALNVHSAVRPDSKPAMKAPGGEDAKRRAPWPLSSDPPPDDSPSSDDEDSNTVYYSVDGKSDTASPAKSRSQLHADKGGGASDDDDVPLAQRVPTALKAQLSIRQQIRGERLRKEPTHSKNPSFGRARVSSPPPPLPVATPARRCRNTTPSPPPATATPALGGRKAMPSPPPTVATPVRGVRKRSLSAAPDPGKGTFKPTPGPATRCPPITPEDLIRRLQHLQGPLPETPADRGPLVSSLAAQNLARSATTKPRSSLQRSTSTSRSAQTPSQDNSLKSKHALHQGSWHHIESTRPLAIPGNPPSLGRSTTLSSQRAQKVVPRRVSPDAMNTASRAGRTDTPVPTKPGRINEDSKQPSCSASRVKRGSEDNRQLPSSSSQHSRETNQRPPLPTSPISMHPPQQLSIKVSVAQQKIFVGDTQRFCNVEVTPSTTAGDVIKSVISAGTIDKSGSWMLWERGEGLERPIRDFELVSDVTGSWNVNRLFNMLIIKSTHLAQVLCASAIPSVLCPRRSWVEWKSKRDKSKSKRRWLVLKGDNLWLSKRGVEEDQVHLCSLSNFDAYYVTTRPKSQQLFSFVVKSTDNESLFENPADYKHTFSCSQGDGEAWIEAILVARSYALHQAKHVIPTTPSQAEPPVRPRTRKQSISAPLQRLIKVTPPFSLSTTNVTFEPGSLLAKQR